MSEIVEKRVLYERKNFTLKTNKTVVLRLSGTFETVEKIFTSDKSDLIKKVYSRVRNMYA